MKESFDKIIKKIKVIFTQIIAFILSFFKDTNLVYVKKVYVKKKVDDKEEKKEIDINNNIVSGDSTPLPDEDRSHSDKHLTYDQSIANIPNDMKEEVVNKLKDKEIYFSEYIVLNTIMEILEKKNDFNYKDLSKDKKVKVRSVIEGINDNISPSLKKEMYNNKIKTKEELKTNIENKIGNKYNNDINNILIIEEEPIKEEIKEVKVKPIIEDKEEKKDIPIISIEKEKKDNDDNDLLTIKKEDKDKIYFIADMLNAKKEIDTKKKIKVEEKDTIIKDIDKSVGIAIQNKAKNLPFIMVPRDKDSNIDLKEKIRESIIKGSLNTATVNVTSTDKVKAGIDTVKEEIKPRIKIEEDIPEVEITKPRIKIEEDLEITKPRIKIEEDIEVPEIKEIKDDTSYSVFEDEIDTMIKNKVQEEKETIKKEIQELNEKEENTKKDIIDIIEDKEDMQKNIDEIQEDLLKVSEIKNNIIRNRDIDTLDNEITEEEINNKDDEIQDIDEEEEFTEEIIKNNEEKKEDKAFIEIVKEETIDIDNYEEKSNKLIGDTRKELEKEEFEDKDYDKYEKDIDDMLYDLEMLSIKNSAKLSINQLSSINNIKKDLKDLKKRVSNQKEIDIEKEKKDLEEKITEEEINKLQQEVKKLHLEHQVEVDEDLLKRLKRLEEDNDSKLEDIEKGLIKKKLKRTSKLLEIPSLLALPFVRNRYFFYFTIGMFVNNHFDFLNAIFRRKEKKYEQIDLTPLKNGKNALEESIDLTYRNIVYLDVLEEEALAKYPSLEEDEEFIKYINNIRTKLNNTYEKLEKKKKMINKYIYKIDSKNKILIKEKLIQNKDAA